MLFWKKKSKKYVPIPFSPVKNKYLLNERAYRPIVEDFFNKVNPTMTEEYRKSKFHNMIIDFTIKELYTNYLIRFHTDYLTEHPEIDVNKFMKAYDSGDEVLQRYIDENISNLREILEGYALDFLNK